MKIILLCDVPKVGRKGEMKEVKDGLAINLLIPQRKAVGATKEHIAFAKLGEKQKENREKKNVEEAEKLKNILNEKEIKIHLKTNKEGHLFRKVNSEDIMSAIKEICNIDLNESSIAIPTPIKEIGLHQIHIIFNKEKIEIPITIV